MGDNWALKYYDKYQIEIKILWCNNTMMQYTIEIIMAQL